MQKRQRMGSRRGAAAIEFGFWLPVMFIMLSGIIDFGWYMTNSEAVMRAARDGARTGAATSEAVGAAPGTDINPAAIAGAQEVLTALNVSGCTVTPVTQVAGMKTVEVTVNCPWSPLFGVVPALGTSIEYSFTMFTELQPITVN